MLSVRPIIVSSGESIFAKFAGLIHNDQSEISFSIPQLTLPWQPLRRSRAWVLIAAATLSGNSLRQTVRPWYLCSPSSKIGSNPLKGCEGNCGPGGK